MLPHDNKLRVACHSINTLDLCAYTVCLESLKMTIYRWRIVEINLIRSCDKKDQLLLLNNFNKV